MAVSLKYAKVERERRFLLTRVPDGVVTRRRIIDRYVVGSRLRLREVLEDGTIVAEIDDGEAPSELVPEWLDVAAVVTHDDEWTGGRLAR